VLYLITWLTDFSLLLFVFAGTRRLAEQGASPRVLGLLGASFFLASALSNACMGSVADRIGRRRVSMTGALSVFGSLSAITFAPLGSALYYASYTLVGVSIGFVYPPIMAWLGQGKSGLAARRAFLLFCLSFNLGMVSAQLTGGWLFETVGPRAPLYVAMVLILTAFMLLCCLREPSAMGSAEQVESSTVTRQLAQSFTRLTWIANFGGMFSMSIVWFLFPILIVELEVMPMMHGAVLAVGRIVVMSTYSLMHFFPFWHFRLSTAVVVQILGAMGLVAIARSHSAAEVMIGIAALSLLMGYNYFASLYYSSCSSAESKQGRAFGLNEASLGLGAAGGSLIGGIAAGSLGSRAPFAIATALVIFLLVTQIIVYAATGVRDLRNRPAPPQTPP
jgi:MFS family permease